jgi:type I restriction enzyme S subunit
LKGLDASILRISLVADLNPAFRIDAEFFSRAAMKALTDIRRVSHQPLRALCSRIQHPVEVKREYEDTGLLTVMAKDVRSNRVELSDPSFMPEDLRPVVQRNQLRRGDTLITRTGANYGQSAPWKLEVEAFACADILVLREPKTPSGYLSSFLECAKGKPLVLRGGYGAGQPHIAPPYLAEILIPRFDKLESLVDSTVELSVRLQRQASETLDQAEHTLLIALGLDDWTPLEPLAYTASAADVLGADRIDAQYFRPLFSEVEARLLATGRAVRLGSILTTNARGRQPLYDNEGLPVVNSKHVRTNRVILNDNRVATEAGSPVIIWNGDVLLNGTGVGTIGRAAPYLHIQRALPDNHVTVLRTHKVDPVYLAVFLNSLLGRWQIERHIKGSSGQIELYPNDIARIVIWDAPNEVQQQARDAILSAFQQEQRANELPDAAKRAVEIAIEDGEPAAAAFLAQAEMVCALGSR